MNIFQNNTIDSVIYLHSIINLCTCNGQPLDYHLFYDVFVYQQSLTSVHYQLVVNHLTSHEGEIELLFGFY